MRAIKTPIKQMKDIKDWSSATRAESFTSIGHTDEKRVFFLQTDSSKKSLLQLPLQF